MQHTLEGAAGIYRDADALAKAVDTLRELQDRAESATIGDPSRAFNTQLVAALELAAMLDIAESIVHSALRREESRGAHQRTDFPKRNDERFLAHSLAYREPDGGCRVEYAPVTITRWPPGERVYGR
jgi:fumarate reductase flavoprotein subunit